MLGYFEELIEELKAMIPKALYDKADDTVQGDRWIACLECIHEMADAWEELNGENLVWVPGHYETKDSGDFTTPSAEPLSYPYYQLCCYDKAGCFDEEFGKEDRLFGFLGTLFIQNIVNKYDPDSDKIRVFYHVGKFNSYEITLTPVTGSDLQAGDSGTITCLMRNYHEVPFEPKSVDSFIQNKISWTAAKTDDILRVQFGNKTYCELKVVAQR